MRYTVSRVVPVCVADKVLLMRTIEGMIDEMLEKRSSLNVTEGEVRLNVELTIHQR